ncbi:hypothetical protein [Devosia sp. Root685]|uniref:hypothetical protein n=1 Tax=Devosia sp. Root685 TaxID=1736587 RepID=UPI0012E386DD|nr:hypothetical protein [Devosia sp. Root685]
MIGRWVAALALVCLSGSTVVAQEDAIGAPGPFVLEGTSFELAWTSHPTDAFYKQEYVPEGQTVEAYDQMFMVDVLTNGVSVGDAAGTMIKGLQERKASDPVVNFDVMQNEATGEMILDFMLSDSSGEAVIVEWNAYRYVPLEDGVAMFGISRRGYGDGASELLRGLKETRMKTIQALAELELPEVGVE